MKDPRPAAPVLESLRLLPTVSFADVSLTDANNRPAHSRGPRCCRMMRGDSSRAARATFVMPNLDFTLTGEYVELHNLLKITGLADSGGTAKMFVASGAVKVDGAVELRKTCKIRAGQVVLFGDTRIAVHEA